MITIRRGMQLCSMTVFGVVLMVSQASAQPWHKGKGGFSEEMKEKFRQRIIEHLELTEEQQAVMKEFREKRKEIYKEGHTVRAKAQRLSDMLKNKQYSEAEIQSAFKDASSSFEALNKKRIENMMLLRKNLSQHQLDSLFVILDKMKKKGHWGSKHDRGKHGSFGHHSEKHDYHGHSKKRDSGFDMGLP